MYLLFLRFIKAYCMKLQSFFESRIKMLRFYRLEGFTFFRIKKVGSERLWSVINKSKYCTHTINNILHPTLKNTSNFCFLTRVLQLTILVRQFLKFYHKYYKVVYVLRFKYSPCDSRLILSFFEPICRIYNEQINPVVI